MGKMKNDIGELFGNTFEKHVVVPEADEWDMLSTTLQKRNFFRFNATQFNIYYASTIVFCFLVCAGVGSHYTYTNFFKPNRQIEASLKISSNSDSEAVSKESGTVEDVEVPDTESTFLTEKKEAKTGSSNPNKNGKVEVKENQEVAILSEAVKKKDSIHVQANVTIHQPASKDSANVRPKRVLYITKQDTILKYDTLHAPKQKKKWFK